MSDFSPRQTLNTNSGARSTVSQSSPPRDSTIPRPMNSYNNNSATALVYNFTHPSMDAVEFIAQDTGDLKIKISLLYAISTLGPQHFDNLVKRQVLREDTGIIEDLGEAGMPRDVLNCLTEKDGPHFLIISAERLQGLAEKSARVVE